MRTSLQHMRLAASQKAEADDAAGSAAAGDGSSSSRPLSVRANMLYNTIGSLSYQLCLWLTTMLVVLLSDGYGNAGTLAFAMTIGNMMSGIGTYDMRTYQVSDVRYEHTQGEYVGFRLVTLAIGIAITTAYATITSPDTVTLATTIAYVLFKTDESFADVLYGVEQVSERMDFIGRSETCVARSFLRRSLPRYDALEAYSRQSSRCYPQGLPSPSCTTSRMRDGLRQYARRSPGRRRYACSWNASRW